METLGRAAQRVIRESIQKSKPKWDVKVPKGKQRNVADIIIRMPKYNVLVKMKTTKVGFFRYSLFNEQQLSVMSQFYMQRKRNLAFIFLYYANEKKLVSIDIHSLLGMKARKIVSSDGKNLINWDQLDEYFKEHFQHKSVVLIKKRPKREDNSCIHHWMIESMDDAFRRTSRRNYSMGYCKYCGKVNMKFANFMQETNGFNR